MNYDNKSRQELIELLNKRNATLKTLEQKVTYLENKLNQLEADGMTKLADDFTKQLHIQTDLISQLRNGRAEMLTAINHFNKEIYEIKNGGTL